MSPNEFRDRDLMSHPDYLGHTEFVSDANGDAYQYFWYSPFGDAIIEEHANTASFSSRYLFNAKELDPETGRYYYGARYYDPGLSIWLSVDPLSHVDPNLTPYHFVRNNPIMLVDPDGLTSWEVGKDGKPKMIDNNRYARNNETGEIRQLTDDESGAGDGETMVDRYIGTAGDKKEERYFDVKPSGSVTINADDKKDSETLHTYSGESFQDSRDFVEWMDKVSTSEFSFSYSKDSETGQEYFDIGTFFESGRSTSIPSGGSLIYKLHNHPGGLRPSPEDADAAFRSNHPNVHYEVYTKLGYYQYWPKDKRSKSGMSYKGPSRKSRFTYGSN